MGLFDSIANLFTGGNSAVDAARNAQAQNQQLLNTYGTKGDSIFGNYDTQARGALGDARTATLGALGTGLTNQLGAYNQGLGTLQGTNTGALQSALNTIGGVSTDPLTQALGAQRSGLQAVQDANQSAVQAGQAGVAAWDPLRQTVQGYDPAVQAYLGSIGVGGDAARTAALNAFRAGPGYQFQQDEARRQGLASASQTGLSQSGNAMQALQDRAQNIANQEYGNWQNRVGAFVPLQQSGYTNLGQGLAGANRNLADIYSQGGRDIAGAQGRIADAYGNLFTGQRGISQDLAGVYGNLFQGQQGINDRIAAQYNQIGGTYGRNASEQAGYESGYGSDIAGVAGNVAGGRANILQGQTTGGIQGNNQVAAAQQEAANRNAQFWGSIIGAGTKAAAGGGGLGSLGSGLMGLLGGGR